jgi:hypothetical protein
MMNDNEILKQLVLYLGNQISLDEFEDRFVRGSWNAHREGDPVALRLISAIELRLAEHSSGHLPDAELREELRTLTEPQFVYFSFPQGIAQPALTGASNPVPLRGVVEPLGAIFSVEYV